jgi:hypothetical protein
VALKGDDKIRQLGAAQKRRMAVELRRAGYSWDDVADAVGYASRGAAYTEVDRALTEAKSLLHTSVEAYRVESIDRRMELIKGLWDRRQDEKVAAEIRRLSDSIDKLTGAERPTVIEFGEGDVDRALRGVDEEFRRRFGAAAPQTDSLAGDAPQAG